MYNFFTVVFSVLKVSFCVFSHSFTKNSKIKRKLPKLITWNKRQNLSIETKGH